MIIDFHGKSPTIGPDVFIAPNATIIGNVEIGAGSSIWFGAVLRGDHGRVVIGAGTSVQDNAVVHAPTGGETIIGDNVVIGHAAVLEGCRVDDYAVIGMSATIIHGAHIGEQAMVAAGAVVTENVQIPPRMLTAGVPAKVRKELEGSALEWVKTGASEYHKLAREYKFLMEASDETV